MGSILGSPYFGKLPNLDGWQVRCRIIRLARNKLGDVALEWLDGCWYRVGPFGYRTRGSTGLGFLLSAVQFARLLAILLPIMTQLIAMEALLVGNGASEMNVGTTMVFRFGGFGVVSREESRPQASATKNLMFYSLIPTHHLHLNPLNPKQQKASSIQVAGSPHLRPTLRHRGDSPLSDSWQKEGCLKMQDFRVQAVIGFKRAYLLGTPVVPLFLVLYRGVLIQNDLHYHGVNGEPGVGQGET